MTRRTYGGPLVDMTGAVDLHCHPFPDLFPRLADDFDIVQAARDAGMKAIVLKCHHENTVSRAYLVQRVIPGIRVYGGIVLNYYVGGVNPAAVEAALRLGGKEVWMPTVDAGYHAEVHGGTGGYDSQRAAGAGPRGSGSPTPTASCGPRSRRCWNWSPSTRRSSAPATSRPSEIVALVREARDVGVEKIVITHPYFKVPNLDLDTLEEVARLGAMPEFGYCTVSPAWQYAASRRSSESCSASGRPGACSSRTPASGTTRCRPRRCASSRRPSSKRACPSQTSTRMIAANPLDLLDPGADTAVRAQDLAWAR